MLHGRSPRLFSGKTAAIPCHPERSEGPGREVGREASRSSIGWHNENRRPGPNGSFQWLIGSWLRPRLIPMAHWLMAQAPAQAPGLRCEACSAGRASHLAREESPVIPSGARDLGGRVARGFALEHWNATTKIEGLAPMAHFWLFLLRMPAFSEHRRPDPTDPCSTDPCCRNREAFVSRPFVTRVSSVDYPVSETPSNYPVV
jgi:hypothetical protein